MRQLDPIVSYAGLKIARPRSQRVEAETRPEAVKGSEFGGGEIRTLQAIVTPDTQNYFRCWAVFVWRRPVCLGPAASWPQYDWDRTLRAERRTIMTHLRLLGTAMLSLVLAGPAMAAGDGTPRLHRQHYQHYARVTHPMRAQDFDHFDLGIARPTYHSGWGGPYGDGDYPGTVDQNMGPPYRAP